MPRSFLTLILSFAFAVMLGGCEVQTPPTPDDTATSKPEDPGTPTTPTTPREVNRGKVVTGDSIRVPYILWGGDIATFHGNGGLKTTEGSLFHQNGLVLEMVDGNDFNKQVADYTGGRSPFLRGTYRMIGLAAERVSETPGAEPVVFLQMTWSAGDHLVGREDIKTIADLKGKTIAIQKDGPHIGMLDDVLKTGNLSWKDVTVKFAKDITGPGSPPELFKADKSIDAAFAITPDMLGLTGGLEATGSGAEGTIKGARVVVSTAELSHSIADVYAVRKDYWEQNPEKVAAFANGYLRSVEEVVDLRRQYEASGSEPYMDLLQMSQDIYGKDALPTLEEDAHGLLMDCSFVGHPGNVSFFTDDKLVYGFADFNRRTQDLAVRQGYAKKATPVLPSPLDWSSAAVLQGLTKTQVSDKAKFKAEALLEEVEGLDADGVLDSRTLVSFTISFKPNQTAFDASQYAEEYKRVMDLSARFGNAAVVIRGHSDTTLVLRDAVKAGMENGKIKRSGSKGSYQYFLDGRPLKLDDQKTMVELIRTSDAFSPVGGIDPRKTMQAGLNLSRERATAVRESLLAYARKNAVRMDESQIQAQGVGIREPLVARPRNPEEAAVNMRVEFRLVRVSAEAMTDADFDF